MKNSFLLFMAVYALNVSASDINERKEYIENMEGLVSIASDERKTRSESILGQHNVPVNKNLPRIEDEEEVLVRSREEVAKRAMALLVVAVKAEGLEQEIVERLLDVYGLRNALSPNESEFIKQDSPSEYEKTQLIWRYESAWVLLWALGYVEELSYPSSICDVPAAVSFLQTRTEQQFLNDSQLRPISEILDEADLIYRYHWAVVDARINGKQSPSNLDSSVVLERHYALNWLIGYMDQEWDDVSTDT